MPLPSNADQVVVQGFLFDEETGGGLQAAVTSEPVALTGQSAAPMVLDAVSHAHIQTRPRVTTPDPVTGYWALLALATNDPDLEAYGGRRITLPGQVARTIEVPWDAPQQVVSAGMAAQINPGNVDGRPKAGDTVRVLWFHSAAGYVAPTPASAYYDAAATRSLIADSIAAAGGGSGTADLPEVDRTTVASDPTTLLGKTTRYSTTSAAINQTLPAAQPGRQLAVGWDAGTNALTLTAAGSDVVGAGSSTTVPFAVLGHLVTLHCTVAGRWRVTSGFTPQAAQDARYMPRPDESGAAAGSLSALRKGSGGGYTLEKASRVRVDGTDTDLFEVDTTPVTLSTLGGVPIGLVDAKGDLLVGTANDALARVAAGSNGQVLTADPSQTPGVKWATPAAGGSAVAADPMSALSQGFAGWSFDSVLADGTSTTGTLPVTARMVAEQAGTVSGLMVSATVAGATPTAGQCFALLVDSASNVIASTGDIGSQLTSVGLKTLAWSTPPTLTVGQVVYGVLCLNMSTTPSLARRPQGTSNARPASSPPPFRFGTKSPAVTSVPSTFDLTGLSALAISFWMALIP